MRRTVIFIFLMTFWTAFAQQQKISVKSFLVNDNDITASANNKLDDNGQKCALLLVTNVDVKGFRFNVGNSFCEVEEAQIDGRPVYKVWLSEGTRWISISNDDASIAPLTKYAFPSSLKKGKTYRMELDAILRSSKNGKQYLTFNISPSVTGLSLEVDDVPWPVSNGRASNLLEVGSHSYRVSAPDYHTDAGVVTVAKANEAQVQNVTLTPMFGYITINGGQAMSDAEVFINGVSIGKGNVSAHKLNSDSYVVKIVKPLYKMYSANVQIKDGETISVQPKFQVDASEVSMSVSDDAEIYIDGEFKGIGQWKGLLSKGDYVVEARKSNHKPTKRTINVPEIDKKYNFALSTPEAILSGLSIESEPEGAKIVLDGRSIGVTPFYVNDIIIGNHAIELSKDGYDNFSSSLVLWENAENKVLGKLKKHVTITDGQVHIVSDPEFVKIKVNGKDIGVTPIKYNGKINENIAIYAEKTGYESASKIYKVKQQNEKLTIKLKPIKYKPLKSKRPRKTSKPIFFDEYPDRSFYVDFATGRPVLASNHNDDPYSCEKAWEWRYGVDVGFNVGCFNMQANVLFGKSGFKDVDILLGLDQVKLFSWDKDFCFKIVPQIGFGLTPCLCGCSMGLRCELVVIKHISLFANPILTGGNIRGHLNYNDESTDSDLSIKVLFGLSFYI